ncbi:MAG: hypothetical protein ACK4TK_04620 [Thiobacillaceae bacterium]
MNEPIIWDAEVCLFSPEMLRAWGLALLVTWLLMMLILGIALAAQGEAEALPTLALVMLAVTGGLGLLGLLVMRLLFRGGYPVRYTVSADGVQMQTVSQVAKRVNRLAIVVGILTGKPGLLGSGLIARSRETEALSWQGAFRAELRPKRHLIVLRGAWRNLMLVQCTPQNFAQVAARVQVEITRHGTDRRLPAESPLPAYLWRSALVGLASWPIFALHAEYDLDLLLPLLMFCFALATVWLIPLFGWVVLGCLGLIAITVAIRLTEPIASIIHPGRSFSYLQVMSGGDWVLLGLALGGGAVLAWLSLASLRGRLPAALMADQCTRG